jgi:hypothetical protein
MLSTRSNSKWISRAAACALALTAGLAVGNDWTQASNASRLVGTWRVTVVTYNCANPAQASPPFASYLAFGADGMLLGTTTNPAFPAGQRSGDFGAWRRLGFNFYRAVSEAFIHFPSGAPVPAPASQRGYQRIEQGIQMTSRDSFTSEATTTFFDSSDAPYFSACARATGTRMD